MSKGISIAIIIIIILALAFGLMYLKPKEEVKQTTDESAQTSQNSMDQNSNQSTTGGSITNQMDAKEIAPGLKSVTTVEGKGDGIKNGQTASVFYTGRLLDGTVFDSNVDPAFKHPEAFEFKLGAGMVIKGWDLGVEGMKVGEKRTLTISPELAYGNQKVGALIPANSTLVFDVELKEIK
jgi:FKBP-type peptidyl-prolyl cis-trans isomerase